MLYKGAFIAQSHVVVGALDVLGLRVAFFANRLVYHFCGVSGSRVSVSSPETFLPSLFYNRELNLFLFINL